MDNQFVLRRANVTDIDALSQLFQKTFQETYVEDAFIPYSKNTLDSFYHSTGSPEWFANKIDDSQQAVWIVEDKVIGELIAYAVAGPCDDYIPHSDIQLNKDGGLNSLFVRRDRRNHGFGQQLMNFILPWLDKHYPTRPIWLSVFSENFKAQKFYEHYGFKKVGEYDYLLEEFKDREFIMKRQTHT